MKGPIKAMVAVLGLAMLFAGPMVTGAVYAQGGATMTEALPNPEVAGSSTENADALPGVDGGGATGGANRPTIDPFKALIEPKADLQPVTPVAPVINAPPPLPPPIPPVNFKVNAVAGDHPNYVAVIEFENQTYIVQKDTKVPDEQNPAFDVKEVTAEKVVVFDRKINRLVPKQLITE